MKSLSTVLITILCLQTGFSQINISGQISDKNQTPLEFVNVLLLNHSDSTLIKGFVTDSEGKFQFENVQKGEYLIGAMMLGYSDFFSNKITVSDSNIELPNILLYENSTQLDVVKITAKKPLFEQKIDRTVVNVQNSITATGGTALEVLERSPGVDIDRVNNRISMNGKSGVIVTLNNKQTRLEGQSLIQFLQNLPADNIQILELITTPPASFDAEGDAGIINIETIRNLEEGMNGILTLNAGYGERPKTGASLNFNYRKNRINLFSNLSFNINKTNEDVAISRRLFLENEVLKTDVFSRRPAETRWFDAKIGLDFDLTERTVLGAFFYGYLDYWDLGARTKSEISNENNLFETTDLASLEENNWTHWMTNFNIRHTFLKGGKLSFDFDYLDYLDDNPTNYEELIYDKNDNLTNQRTFISGKKTPVEFQVAKLDYSKKLNEKLNIETGLKGTISNFTNDVGVANLINENWEYEPLFTNVFNLDETIGAAYFSFDFKANSKTNIKAGARFEYLDSHLGSATEADIVVQNYGRLFPSVFISHDLNDDSRIQVSYTERITRPTFNVLAPAFFFWNSNTILSGNPGIRMTITRKIRTEFRYKTTLFALQFEDDENPIVWGQPTIDFDRNIFITRAENMADFKSAMASLNFPISITDWWESRYNFNAFWQLTEPKYEGQTIKVTDLFFSGNMAQNFTLKNDFSVELTGRFRSSRDYGLGSVPFRGSLNLGIQKTFKNSKISLTWNDLFNWGSFFEIQYDRQDLNFEHQWRYEMEGSIFRLSFSQNFGKKDLKKGGNRITGSEEERGRVN